MRSKTNRMAARSLLSLALLAGLLVPVAGTGAQEYTDSTSVLVVEVPVQVVRDGAPVVGLTADNFEIVDEGQKQVVTGFDVLDLREPQTQQKLQNMGAAARRHFVFVFDLSFSQPNAIVRARQAAYDVVRGNLHPSDLIGVATYSNRGGPQLILNFTTDRRQVEQAFTTLGLLQEGRMIDDPLGIVVRESELSGELGRDPASAGGGDDSATGVSADAEMREAIERIAGESSQADLRRQVGIFASTFGFLADLLAPLEGRKHVVFLSEGFDASSLFGTADAERMAEIQEAVEFGEFWKVDNDERFGDSQTLSEMNDVLGRFRKADAAIHAIDIGRLSADGAGTPTARARQDGLFMLSNETGGDFYRNYSDLSEAMSEMLERTSVTYVLAFQPDLQRGRSGYRRLRVKLKDVPRGTKASYREGYFTPSSFSELSESQQKLLSAQQMMSGGPPTGVQGLTASVLATPFSSTASKAFVPVLLQVPAHEISRVPLGEELHLEVYAYAMDAEGTVHDHFAESVRFDMNELGDKIRTTGVKYFGHLDLDPGEYALRVMVVDRRNGSTSVEVTPLVVPDFAEAGLAVLPPLFPEETEQWVLVRETEDGTEQSSRAYPFLFKGQPYVPAVLPVFEVEQVVAVSLVAAKGRSGYLEVDGLVLAEDGTPIPGTFVRVLEREWDESAGVERMIAAFEVPNLPAGKYSLVVTMSDLGSGEVESGTLEFGLGRSADRGAIFNPPLWMPALDEVVDRLGPEDTGRKVVKIDREQLRSSYEEVLRQLAAGRMGGAVQALTELEGALINKKDPMATLAQVVKVERSVLDEVTQRDPDLLLPAILLHKESYSQYRLRKEPYLAVHAKTTTQELIDLYAKRSQSSQAARARLANPRQHGGRGL